MVNFATKNSFAKYGLTMSLLFGLVAITSNQYTNMFFDGIVHRRVKKMASAMQNYLYNVVLVLQVFG